MYEISNFCSLFPAQHFLKLSFWNDFFEDVFLIHLWLCGSSLLLVGSLQLQRAGAALWCGSGFSLQGLPLLWSSGSVVGRTGSVAPWNVGSSWSGDQTHVPCIGRTPNHWTTREVVEYFLIYRGVAKIQSSHVPFSQAPTFCCVMNLPKPRN